MTFQNYTGRSTSRPCNVTVWGDNDGGNISICFYRTKYQISTNYAKRTDIMEQDISNQDNMNELRIEEGKHDLFCMQIILIQLL